MFFYLIINDITAETKVTTNDTEAF